MPTYNLTEILQTNNMDYNAIFTEHHTKSQVILNNGSLHSNMEFNAGQDKHHTSSHKSVK